jgi:hypothetical protein
VGSEDTNANVSIGTGSGDLADVNSTGTSTDADVNLGGLLGNTTVTPPIGTPTPPVTQVAQTFDTLSASDQRDLRIRCKNVLAAPAGYSHNVVSLCHLIATLR